MYVLAAYLSEGKAQLIHIDLWEKGNLVKKVFGYTAETTLRVPGSAKWALQVRHSNQEYPI